MVREIERVIAARERESESESEWFIEKGNGPMLIVVMNTVDQATLD